MAPEKFKVAIATDSFKGTMTALEAAECIERGLRRELVNISVRKVPMADGGDGFVQAIVDATKGRLKRAKVHDPLGRPIWAQYGVTGNGRNAIIEMAATSGLVLLKPSERNPMNTTTHGTGDLIRAALRTGVRKILIGIGGSATNDGGMGMARALGVRFLDENGREIPEGGGALEKLARIDLSDRMSAPDRVGIEVACDVDNPLTGPKGAARVYGEQKGATSEQIRVLDENLKHLARILRNDLGIDVERVPGAGAAGGLGAGLLAFLGATLRPGIDLVADAIRLHKRLSGCDLVITGEGRTDGQTLFGKAPMGVIREARQQGIPVIVISGSIGPGAEALLDHGVDAYYGALSKPLDDIALLRKGPRLLEDCAAQVARVIGVKIEGLKTRSAHKPNMIERGGSS
jgi:glycerate kinase